MPHIYWDSDAAKVLEGMAASLMVQPDPELEKQLDADYIGTVFGRGEGKERGYPGHEETELALVKLYRATGEKRYLELARYFVEERGASPNY